MHSSSLVHVQEEGDSQGQQGQQARALPLPQEAEPLSELSTSATDDNNLSLSSPIGRGKQLSCWTLQTR